MQHKRFYLKRLWLLLFWAAAALLFFAATKLPSFAEWYALNPYSLLARGGSFFSSLLPFSLAELLIFLLLASLPFMLVFWIIRLIRADEHIQFLYRSFINLICTLGILVFLFTAFCGINYYRYPFEQVCGLEIKPSSEKELTDMCNHLAGEVNTLRPKVYVDKNNVMGIHFSNMQQAGKAAQNSFESVQKDYPTLTSGYGIPKPVLSSRAMSACQITGVYFPFTFEANVNTDVPDCSIPFTMCHELAHMRGYMREDEANFIAYLACEKSQNIDFQYSGKMMAFIHASNALSAINPNAGEQLYASLDEGVRRDLKDNSAYWNQFEGPVAKAADAINDTYLKANNQQDGVKSYNRMLDLLLAEYRTHKK